MRMDDFALIDLICKAPVSLDKKLELLSNLFLNGNSKEDIFKYIDDNIDNINDLKNLRKEIRRFVKNKLDKSLLKYISKVYSEIDDANNYLKGDEADKELYIYNLHSEWYDTDVFMEKSYNEGLFKNFKEVIGYIKNEEEPDDTGESWYRIELWKVGDKLSDIYNFYTYGCEVCWFEKMRKENGNIYSLPDKRNYLNSGYIDNVSTSFKTGDIISVDCRPFGPPFNAIVLETKHQYDSCFPNILFQIPYTDEWSIAPLKSGGFYKDIECGRYYSPLSALYRARTVTSEELKNIDENLITFSKKIIRKESYVEEIYDKWHSYNSDYKSIEIVKEMFEIN